MVSFGSWSVLTTNFLFILYGALCSVTFCSILHLSNGQWRFQVRYIASCMAVLFPLAFILLIILLANGESTFVWLAHAHDPEHHLNAYHNYGFLVARQIIGFLIVAGLFLIFIKYQHESTNTDSPEVKRKFRNIALLIPFAYVLYGTMVAWDFEMTMVPNWHSASYGAYHFVSNFHAFLAFFAILLFALERSGKLEKPFQMYCLNHLAQMMLAFTILWTYFFFTQYLIMWYGRLPEEFPRFTNMMYHDIGILFWMFLALKFIIPLVSLVFTNNRHDPAAISMIAASILIGTWIERYTWISGSTTIDNYHIPFSSGFDWIVTLVVLGLAFFLVRFALRHYGQIRAET